MKETLKTAKVGLFVVALVVAGWLAWRFVDETTSGDGGYTVWAVFDDAQGLVEKSRVLIAGIEVGYIQSIRLWGARARIDIHIEEGVVLYEDAAVAKRSASLLGESILVLHPGTRGKETLDDGDRIATVEETPGTDALMSSLNATATSLQKVAEQVERAFGTDEGGQQMADSLRNLNEALESANRLLTQNEAVVSRTLEEVEITVDTAGPKLLAILDNVESVTRDVRGLMDENKGDLEQATGQVTDTVASVNRAAQQLEVVLSDVREVTERTARGEGTIGRLTADEALIDEVEGVVEGVGDIVGGIGRLQTIVELRSEYNFLANTFKNYVGLRLQPREDRYYFIQLVNDPRGLTEFSQTWVRTSPPLEDRPAVYQETRIVTRDAFRFTLMFAKRIHFATFRFGILESTGGIGVDLHLMDDRLEINGDVFAVGEQPFPRFRVRLAYEVVKRFWLLGGIDDALNESSDFFLGAQLRFNDRDLKSILPFVSTPTG